MLTLNLARRVKGGNEHLTTVVTSEGLSTRVWRSGHRNGDRADVKRTFRPVSASQMDSI